MESREIWCLWWHKIVGGEGGGTPHPDLNQIRKGKYSEQFSHTSGRRAGGATHDINPSLFSPRARVGRPPRRGGGGGRKPATGARAAGKYVLLMGNENPAEHTPYPPVGRHTPRAARLRNARSARRNAAPRPAARTPCGCMLKGCPFFRSAMRARPFAP